MGVFLIRIAQKYVVQAYLIDNNFVSERKYNVTNFDFFFIIFVPPLRQTRWKIKKMISTRRRRTTNWPGSLVTRTNIIRKFLYDVWGTIEHAAPLFLYSFFTFFFYLFFFQAALVGVYIVPDDLTNTHTKSIRRRICQQRSIDPVKVIQ